MVWGQANVQWGAPGDIPVPGDYNADRRTEIAVFRPADGGWYLQQSGAAVAWGRSGDIPVAGDYNGDGATDLAVFRTSDGVGGSWLIRNVGTFALGLRGDIPVPADYDGDGKTDMCGVPSDDGGLVRPELLVRRHHDRGAGTAGRHSGPGEVRRRHARRLRGLPPVERHAGTCR